MFAALTAPPVNLSKPSLKKIERVNFEMFGKMYCWFLLNFTLASKLKHFLTKLIIMVRLVFLEDLIFGSNLTKIVPILNPDP